MAKPRQSPEGWFVLELIIKFIRFIYLVWGGILLVMLILFGRPHLEVASFVAHSPLLYLFTSLWGNGVLLGLGVLLCTAALIELWELISLVLISISRGSRH